MDEHLENRPSTRKIKIDTIKGSSKTAEFLADMVTLPAAVLLSHPANVIGWFLLAIKFGQYFWNWRDSDAPGFKETDTTLKTTYARLVYEGGKALKLKGINLVNGDNYQYLGLPRIENSQDLGSWIDLTQQALEKFKRRNREDEPICLKLPDDCPPFIQGVFSSFTRVSTGELFANKGFEPIVPSPNFFILTPEQLEDLIVSPQDIFIEGLGELADEQILHLIALAKSSIDPETRERVAGLVEKRLQEIIQKELLARKEGPENVLDRSDYAHPIRRRVNRTLYLRQREDKSLHVVESSEDGIITHTLTQALKINPNIVPIDFQSMIRLALIENHPLKKGQIAYGIYQLLQSVPFAELFRERKLTEEELLSSLKDKGLSIKADPFDLDWDLFDFGKTLKRDLIYYPLRQLRPLGYILTAYALLGMLGSAWEHRGVLMKSLITPPTLVEQLHYQTTFPQAELPSRPEWKITSAGLNPAGYYTEATSHSLQPGARWEVVNDRVRILDLPAQITGESNLVLERKVDLPLREKLTIRLPIKNGTSPVALAVSQSNGSPAEFKAYQLADGTVEVEVEQTYPRYTPWVGIRYILAETQQPQITATQKLSSLLTEQLHPYSQDIINRATEAVKRGGRFSRYLRSEIINNYYYSLYSDQNHKLLTAQTAEDLANAISSLRECPCGVCNTFEVLLASKDSSEEVLNMAFGYIHNLDTLASGRDSNYLVTRGRHAYGITDQGIILDATPFRLSESYLERIKRAGEIRAVDQDSLWQSEQVKLENDGLAKNALFHSALLFLLAASLIPAYKGAEWIKDTGRRLLEEPNRIRGVDKLILSTYSQDSLLRAEDFMTWVSWGDLQNRDRNLTAQNLSLSNKEVLATIRHRVNYDRLRDYNYHPGDFEGSFTQLTVADKARLRALAVLLRV